MAPLWWMASGQVPCPDPKKDLALHTRLFDKLHHRACTSSHGRLCLTLSNISLSYPAEFSLRVRAANCSRCGPALLCFSAFIVHLSGVSHIAGTDSLTLDFATIVYRLQLLGFNAVRLPFSFSDLYDKQPLSQQRNCAQARSPHSANFPSVPGSAAAPLGSPTWAARILGLLHTLCC